MMDERAFHAKLGQPIPDWDANHRLPTDGFVGPEIRDSATIFRLNSTFMDVSDQPHMMRQWMAGGALTAAGGVCALLYVAAHVLFVHPLSHGDALDVLIVAIIFSSLLLFATLAIRLGRDEFFSLTRRPIRFNRSTKKLYALRKPQRESGEIVGDLVWEIPWDENAVFCVHKGPAKFDLQEHYHIRCYMLDHKGNVQRAFALGREWQGTDGMRDLLAQWNFWCAYMNDGPQHLPKPLLYLSEYEDTAETFLYCLYEMGFGMNKALRIIFTPFALFLTTHRLLSLWTCRQPVWPDEVLDVSRPVLPDPYDQPTGGTPIGWAATARARQDESYPRVSTSNSENWVGEPDPLKNARLWEKDVLPFQ